MTIPVDATKVHLDSGTDDASQARAELSDLIDKFNTLLAHLRAVEIVNKSLAIGDGLQNEGPDVDLSVLLQSNSGLVRASAGIATDKASQAEAEAGTNNIKTMTPLRAAQAFDASFPTGAVLDYMGSSAPSGFVRLQGGTIGDAGSGASERANADCEDLFTLIWDSMADAQAPVSTGRGVSAAADWGAGKTITLLDTRGRSPVGTGQGAGLTNRVNGVTGGEEDHQTTVGETANHRHDLFGSNSASGGSKIAMYNSNTASNNPTAYVGGDLAHNTMHPYYAVYRIAKL